MKIVVAAALLLISLTLPAAWSHSKDQPNILAITDVTVIDAKGAAAKANMTVIITGDRITDISKTGEVGVPKNAQTVDGKGKFLIPGLWDMHVHTVAKGLPEFYFPMFVANGVTGVRDMAAHPELLRQVRKDISAGKLPGVHIFGGPMVDGPMPVWPGPGIPISDEAGARQIVAVSKDNGADFIKVYSLLPRPAYFALADEAKKRGIPFAGHVPISVTAAEASDAGQKSIEHAEGILIGCSAVEAELRRILEDSIKDAKDTDQMRASLVRALNETYVRALETYSDEKAAALFARFARNGTWQAPTLVVARTGALLEDRNFTNDPRLKYVRRHIRDSWTNGDDFRVKNRPPNAAELGKQLFQTRLKFTYLMHRAGVKILAATDALVLYVFPGFSLHDELELFVQAGLSPMEALQTATLNPATYVGLSDVLGTVEKGKTADLVLLEANPLENISNTKKISAVVLGGKLIPRVSLDKMLKDAEAAANRN